MEQPHPPRTIRGKRVETITTEEEEEEEKEKEGKTEDNRHKEEDSTIKRYPTL